MNQPTPKKLPVVEVLGTHLAVTTYLDLAERLVAAARCKQSLAVDFSNTHIVTLRCHDPAFRLQTDSFDIFVPDGMPLVWVMNRHGARLADRVYGPTFTGKFLASCQPNFTHYLIGGSVECGEKFRQRMLSTNPTLKFVGSYHGRCDPHGHLSDDDRVFSEINRLKPDFVWVGLGTPKQYAWIQRARQAIPSGIFLSVGFAFDVNAGTKRDAPAIMQKLGFTWLFRLCSEPRRLIPRYLKFNSLFLYYLLTSSRNKASESRRIN